MAERDDDVSADAARLAQACAAAMLDRDRATRALSIEIRVAAPESAIATMRVRDDMVNGFGICHGGLVFALADTAFAFACNSANVRSVSASGHIEFLRPAKAGDRLVAECAREGGGRRQGIYGVRVRNQDDETVALFRGRAVATGESVIRSDT